MITINGKYIRTNMKESYFGERALLMNEPRTATVISKTSSEMLVLKKNDFESLFDKSIRAQLLKRINLQNDSIELEDLSVIKLIGNGTFGSVFLVAHKKTRELYALKSISNTDIRHYKIKKNIKTSKEILLQIENMFVIKLIKTLSDSERVYFLMEYVPSITFKYDPYDNIFAFFEDNASRLEARKHFNRLWRVFEADRLWHSLYGRREKLYYCRDSSLHSSWDD